MNENSLSPQKRKRKRKATKVFGTQNVTMYKSTFVHEPDQAKNKLKKVAKVQKAKEDKFADKWEQMKAALKADMQNETRYV